MGHTFHLKPYIETLFTQIALKGMINKLPQRYVMNK